MWHHGVNIDLPTTFLSKCYIFSRMTVGYAIDENREHGKRIQT